MKHFARSSLIVAIFFGIDKVLGLTRQLIIARQFALSYELDVFNAANNIPDLLSALISGGALGIALIPVLSEYLELKGKPAAWELFSHVLNLAFLVTAGISLIIVVFAPWLVNNVIVPGFPAEQKALTIELMRLDLLAIIIFSISGLAMASLQANQHFLFPAMAPALYSIGQIFGASILAPKIGYQLGPVTLPAFGLGIHGLVYGVILGALLHLAIQIPALLHYGFRWYPGINLRDSGMRQVLMLFGPRILTMSFIQVEFIVRDNLASRLGEGAVTSLNLGWFIMQVPETLIGTAIGIALLPTISEIFADGNIELFKRTINSALRVMLALTIPATLLIIIGIRPLIQVAFGLKAASTEMIVIAARAYLIGLVGNALLEIASRSFYAQKNAKIPLMAAAFNAIGFTLSSILLSQYLGHAGIALANALIFTLQSLLLLFILNRKYPGVLDVRSTLLRAGLASIGVSVCLYIILQTVHIYPLFVSLGGMALGMLVVLPFIIPEMKLLLALGVRK